MALSKMVLVATAALMLSADAVGFSYDRCATDGPAAWSGFCQGYSENSPIDVCGAVAFPGAAPTPNCSASWSVPQTGLISNNGHTLQLNVAPASPMTTDFGDLGAYVYHSNKNGQVVTSPSNRTYAVEQIHFHWGRTDRTDEGSEHYLQGRAYPLEGHFVHYNTFCGTSVTNAVANCKAGEALLVVGVMFEIGSTESATMTAIAAAAAGATATKTAMTTATTMSEIWGCSGDYYSYPGGLTTPTCNEIVTWVNVAAPKTITAASLNLIKAGTYTSSAQTELIAKYGNFRPLQPKYSRVVYSSAGTTTACTTTTDTAACTTAPSSAVARFGVSQVCLVLLSAVAAMFAY